MRISHSVVLPAFWAAIARLQGLLSKSFRMIPASSESFEDAFSGLLESAGAVGMPPERVQKRFRSLSRNRAQKHRSRRRLLAKKAHLLAHDDPSDPSEVAGRNELVDMARREISQDEWEILQGIAQDRNLPEIANRFGLSVPALKSRVFRIRERIRSSAVGGKILAALSA